MNLRTVSRLLLVSLVAALGLASGSRALSTAFTYQGQLRQGGSPTTGNCDFQFALFDGLSGGMQIGTLQAANGIAVSGGLFTVQLDFGAAAFTGADRWLQIGVRCPTGAGGFTTLAPRQPLTPAPYALAVPLTARDAKGNPRATMKVLDTGEGFVSTQGPNGNNNVVITSLNNSPNDGFVGLYDPDGNQRVGIGVLQSGDGFVQTIGPNGNANVVITSLNNNPNNGFVGVYDANGNPKAGIYVDANGMGQVFGDNKSFAVDHPNRPGAKIIYTSLEGPEAAIYHRGVVRLVSGRATIQLPEHFVALANPNTITVQLTPGSLDSEGLAFRSIRDGRIDIGELHHGKGSYDVHFVVHALRRGFEGHSPVISAEEFKARLHGPAPGTKPGTGASTRAAGAASPAFGAIE